jgi:hypothetical protein
MFRGANYQAVDRTIIDRIGDLALIYSFNRLFLWNKTIFPIDVMKKLFFWSLD